MKLQPEATQLKVYLLLSMTHAGQHTVGFSSVLSILLIKKSRGSALGSALRKLATTYDFSILS